MKQMEWQAVALGLILAVAVSVLAELYAGGSRPAPGPVRPGVQLVALLLGGYVAGWRAGRAGLLQGMGVAIGYILLSSVWEAWTEASLAQQMGPEALAGPVDTFDLVVRDVFVLATGCVGGWLGHRKR